MPLVHDTLFSSVVGCQVAPGSDLHDSLMLNVWCASQSTKIFVNGVWVGIHRNSQELVATLRQMRRQVRPVPCCCSPPANLPALCQECGRGSSLAGCRFCA